MTRIIPFAVVLALIVPITLPAPALADEPPPTPEQIEAAKKAYAEGKRLFDAKKYVEAVEKFKESYRLSKNPLLLYNVGFTLDQKGDRDMALFYYKKFLSDAPADAAQRPDVTARVKELEAQKPAAGTSTTTGTTTATGTTTGTATTATNATNATNANAANNATSTAAPANPSTTATATTTTGTSTPAGTGADIAAGALALSAARSTLLSTTTASAPWPRSNSTDTVIASQIAAGAIASPR